MVVREDSAEPKLPFVIIKSTWENQNVGYISLSLFFPMSVFDSKINFRGNQEDGVEEKVLEQVDFAQKMRDAVDVQLVDTNLYMSKELWLPWGSRGAFGGQASGCFESKVHPC